MLGPELRAWRATHGWGLKKATEEISKHVADLKPGEIGKFEGQKWIPVRVECAILKIGMGKKPYKKPAPRKMQARDPKYTPHPGNPFGPGKEKAWLAQPWLTRAFGGGPEVIESELV